MSSSSVESESESESNSTVETSTVELLPEILAHILANFFPIRDVNALHHVSDYMWYFYDSDRDDLRRAMGTSKFFASVGKSLLWRFTDARELVKLSPEALHENAAHIWLVYIIWPDEELVESLLALESTFPKLRQLFIQSENADVVETLIEGLTLEDSVVDSLVLKTTISADVNQLMGSSERFAQMTQLSLIYADEYRTSKDCNVLEALLCMPQLKHFELTNRQDDSYLCYMKGYDMELLQKVFASLPQLESFRFDDSISSSQSLLPTIAQNCPRLCHLRLPYLFHADVFAQEHDMVFPRLQELDISELKISDYGVRKRWEEDEQ